MESQAPSIQWFPGHMAKTRRMMQSHLKLVDLVVELRDARIPDSSSNPEIERLVGAKKRVILLGKNDMADPAKTRLWIEHYEAKQVPVVAADCRSGKGLGQFVPLVERTLAEERERMRSRGMVGRPLRLMAVGVPNVGKSSFINRLASGRRAKVEDRPGVTRGVQWVKVTDGMELLDMPGVLWPKFEDRRVGEHLAFTGAVKDGVVDIEALACRLLERLARLYPELLAARYGFEGELAALPGWQLLEQAGRRRGMLIAGGEIDTERASVMVLDEFRSGTLGRITLEVPDDAGR